MGSINNISNYYLQPGFSLALPGASLPAGASASGSSSLSDEGQLSPIAQLVGTLQQLQQSNPAEYKQLIQQIAANLQSGASTAQTDNPTAANQLNQLATDFTNAAASGQLPSLQDVTRTPSGHHHHHHHAASPESTANGTQNDALDPLAIIENTLASAGISVGTSASTSSAG